MNFTKEYLDLCKNEKVQGLRPFSLDYGEWYWAEYTKGRIEICCVDNRYGRQMPERTCEYWLPRSDQLDEIILNICKEKFDGYFQYEMCFITTEWYGTIRYWQKSKEYMKDDELMRYAIKIEENPLICKIKLLISLLGEEE